MPGCGQLESYEEAPGLPGAYRFKTRTGQWVTANGPAAEDMRKKIDEANAMGPQKTAGLAADAFGIPAARPDVGPAMSVAPPSAPAPAMSVAPPPAAPAMSPNPGPQPSRPPPSPPGKWASQFVGAPGAPPPQGGRLPGTVPTSSGPEWVQFARNNDGSIVEMRKGADPNNPQPGDLRVFRPGSAGSKGGWMDRSMSVQGAHNLNPEYEEKQKKFQGQEERSTLLASEAATRDAAAQQAYNEGVRDFMANQAVEAQKQQDDAQARFDEINTKHAKAEKDYLGSKVDPSQVTSGVPGFIAVLGAAMNTFGNSMMGSPEMGGKILNARIADNIRAQEAAIAIKRDGADNALKRLTEETGNLDLAKASLKSIQLGRLKSQLEVDMKDGRDTQRQANAVKMHTIVSKAYVDAEEDRRIRAQGVVTKQMQNMPGSAGRAGGYSLPSIGDIQGSKGALAPQIVPKEGEGGPVKKSADVVKYESTLSAVDRSLSDFVEAHGGAIDPATGEISGTLSLPTDWPGPDSDDVGGAKSTLAQLGNVYANMLNSGAEAGQPFKDKVTPGIGLTDNPEAAIKAMAREVALRKQQNAGVPPK